MSCCGERRSPLRAPPSAGPTSAPPARAATAPVAPARRTVVAFEYVGRTGLTAFGAATGRRYRFDRPGARVVVDPRDRPSLAAVPGLRPV